MNTTLPTDIAAAPGRTETPFQRAERCHDELVRAAALLRVTASALDAKDDAEDEACAILQAVERLEAVRQALDGAELQGRGEGRQRAA